MLPLPCTLSVHLATSPFMSFPYQSKTHSHKHTLTHMVAICFSLVSLTPTFWVPLCRGRNLFKNRCSCILEHCNRSTCLGVYPFKLWLCSYGFCVSQLVAAYMRVCLSVCWHGLHFIHIQQCVSQARFHVPWICMWVLCRLVYACWLLVEAVAMSRPYLPCSERFCSSHREIELSAGSMGASEKTFDVQMQLWLRQQKNVLKETWYKYQETSATQIIVRHMWISCRVLVRSFIPNMTTKEHDKPLQLKGINTVWAKIRNALSNYNCELSSAQISSVQGTLHVKHSRGHIMLWSLQPHLWNIDKKKPTFRSIINSRHEPSISNSWPW